jgi:flavorubredoxin
MQARQISERVSWLGVVDWDRCLFDSLIPLPDGTSYNAYLVQGSEKVALLDTVDPTMADILMAQLRDVPRIDYIIAHHAEQDHSGTIPLVLEKFPQAKVVVTPKAKGMLMYLLRLPEDVFVPVDDNETLSLGDKTLKFIHAPLLHWPETMVSYLPEDRILFSSDFFGSHIATADLFVTDEGRVFEAAKRYFAEIMMPFRTMIAKNLEKLTGLEMNIIAPSHGQIHRRPAFIMDAYKEWVHAAPGNLVVLPYFSMHGSTQTMVDRLVNSLVAKGVRVELINLFVTDIGKLAMALVDAGTIVVGTPTVLAGPNPLAAYAAFLAKALRTKAQFLSIVGSYGWGGKTVKTLAGNVTNLKVEMLEPVLCKGVPKEDTLQLLDKLADLIARKHQEQGFA